jgi:phosphatidylglycerol lysyltransferase
MNEASLPQRVAPSSKTGPIRILASELIYLLAPRIFAALAAISGVVLLLDLVMPNALDWLTPGDLPIAIFEASHFLSSIAVTFLMVLSFGLEQRMRSAWAAGVVVFALAALFSVAIGHAWTIAVIFALSSAALLGARTAFYRIGGLHTMALAPQRLLLLVLAVGGVAWLGFFSYRNVEYSHDLWWTFAVDADASRFLRGLVVTLVTFLVVIAFQAIRPAPAPSAPARTADVDKQITAIVRSAASSRPDAALAFLADKRFRFSEDGRAFIMYGVRGRNWIAMGPPIGPSDAGRALAFAMKREADIFRANLIFYATPLSFLPVALDLGLSVQKVGENALIDLPAFSLEGSQRSRIRQSAARLKRDGCRFEVYEGDALDPLMAALKEVSSDWLHEHRGTEKAFSLGRFDPGYLKTSPVAVVLLNDLPCAFANVWVSGDKAHSAIDLMRHSTSAPAGVMDLLIAEIALWAKEKGMQTLDLGMAPLSGLASEREAHPLSRIGALIYSHGEDLYGFEGLRKYKDKFRPRWEPVYLAGPSRVSLATAMADVALLTSGGLRGLFAKEPR